MQFSTIVAAVAFASSTAMAVPQVNARSLTPGATIVTEVPAYIVSGAEAYAAKVNATASLSKRDNVGVYLCVNAQFSGYCVHIVQPAGECIELSQDLDNQVSAIGPDADAGDCRFFFDHGCVDNNGERHFDLSSPGTPDLSQTNPAANDQTSSYMCGL